MEKGKLNKRKEAVQTESHIDIVRVSGYTEAIQLNTLLTSNWGRHWYIA